MLADWNSRESHTMDYTWYVTIDSTPPPPPFFFFFISNSRHRSYPTTTNGMQFFSIRPLTIEAAWMPLGWIELPGKGFRRQDPGTVYITIWPFRRAQIIYK